MVSGLLFPVHPDEGVFFTVAYGITENLVPYRDLFDHKPPGLYFLLWPLFALFSNPMTILILGRMMVMTTNLATAGIIYLATRNIATHQRAIIAGLTFIILSPVVHGQFVITEPFMVTFLLLSLYVSFVKKKWFWAALLLGIAAWFKQPALIIVPLHLYYLRRNKPTTIISYGLGLGLSWIPWLVYFGLNNSIRVYFRDVWWFNLSGYSRYPLTETLLLIPQMIWPLGILIGLTGYSFIRFKQRGGLHLSLFFLIPLVLIRPYHHYWLPLLPLMILIIQQIHRRWLIVFLSSVLVSGTVINIYGWGTARRELNTQIRQRPIACDQSSPQDLFWTHCLPTSMCFYTPPNTQLRPCY